MTPSFPPQTAPSFPTHRPGEDRRRIGGNVMVDNKRRRKWSADKKLRIVLETLQSDVKLAELCRREGLSPNQVYQWRKQLLSSAEAVFARKDKASQPDRQTQRLETQNQRMKNVIAEITAENLDLKKTLSD